MIPRDDFAVEDDGEGRSHASSDNFPGLTIRELEESSLLLRALRKPDFQRETNHWSPDQIVSLLQSFVDDQLIPALILWESQKYIFVIDGGHRLSACAHG